MVTKEEGGEVWDKHIQTTVYQTCNQQGPTV